MMGDENNNPKPSARMQVHYFSGRGYAVVNADGYPVTGFFSTKDRAKGRLDKLQAEADQKAKRGPRPCMCCGEVFKSEGIHNRMCDCCRHRDVAPDPLKSQANRARRAA